MSRFLFATFGSLGDLHPYIAVSRALAARGHEAVIAAAEDHRDAVEEAGVEFTAVEPSIAQLGDYRDLVTKVFDVRRGPEFLIRELVMPYLRASYRQLLEASDGADLLVSHPLTFTLPLVAGKLGLPWVSTVLSPMSFMSACDPPIIAPAHWLHRLRFLGPAPYRLLFGLFKRAAWSWEKPLRDLRADLDIPPSEFPALFEGQFSPLRTLALFDPQLAQPQPDWPANTRVCGTPLFDGADRDSGETDELDRFLADGDPPVVFALGSSAVWIAGDFWDNAVAAARQMGRRAILLTGPDLPESLPAGVKAFPYLRYSRVFPQAAVVVHQAGIGTLAQAMRAGRPQLMVPVAFDQPDNAHRAAALGLGRVLPFRKATARRLTAELDMLLAHAGHAEAARSLADELAKIDGAERAADELISLLG